MMKRIIKSGLWTTGLILCLFFGPLGLSHASDVEEPDEATTELKISTEAKEEIKENTEATEETSTETKEAESTTEEKKEEARPVGLTLKAVNAIEATSSDITWYRGADASFFVTLKNPPKEKYQVVYQTRQGDQVREEKEASYQKRNQAYLIPLEEGKLSYRVYVKNEAGDLLCEETFSFAYDNTLPENDVYVRYLDDKHCVEEGLGQGSPSPDTYIFKDQMTLEVLVKDGGSKTDASGISMISASLLKGKRQRETIELHKAIGEAVLISGESYELFRTNINQEFVDGKIQIESIKDQAGNQRTLNKTADFSICIDRDDPVVESNLDGFINNEDYYDKDTETIVSREKISPSYTVKDSFFGRKQEEAFSYVLKDGTTGEILFEEDGQGDGALSAGNHWKGTSYTAPKEGVMTVREGEEASYEASFRYTDPAGHEVWKKNRIVIDQKAPSLTGLSLRGNDQSKSFDEDHDGKMDHLYLHNEGGKATGVVNFHVEDAFLKRGKGDIKVTCVDTEGKKEVSFDATVDKTNHGYDCSGKIELNSEGVWKIYVTAVDKAGNITRETVDCLLISDFTGPQLKISYDKEENLKLYEDAYYSSEAIGVVAEISDDYIKTLSLAELKENRSRDCHILVNGNPADSIHFEWAEDGKSLLAYFTLAKEEAYVYEIFYEDPCGNTFEFDHGTYQSPKLVVDLTDPVITASIKGEEKGREENRSYYSDSVTVELSIKEKNFDPDQLVIRSDTYTYQVSSINERENELEEIIHGYDLFWEVSGDTYKTSFPVEEEANYEFFYDCKDLAGRSAKKEPDAFTIDHTEPAIEITGLEGREDSDILFSEKKDFHKLLDFINYKSFAYFGEKKSYAALIAHDSISGVKEIFYEIHDTEYQTIEEGSLVSAGYGMYLGVLSLREDFKGYIKVSCEDRSLNKSPMRNPRGVVTESLSKHNSSKAIDIKILTKYSGKSGKLLYFNKPVEAALSIKDSYSGIKSYDCEAGSDIHFSKNYKHIYGSKDVIEEAGDVVYEFSKNITLEAGGTNYSSAQDPTQIRLSYEDNAGHKEVEKKSIVIDDKKPEIHVSYESKSNVKNGKYYNKDRLAQVVITERNFSEANVKWQIGGSGGSVEFGAWSHEGDVHRTTVSFSKDGIYRLNFTVTDLAGNKNSYKGEEFVIDKTAPIFLVTFDHNDPKNGKYYNKVRTATVHVSEKNFSQNEIKCDISMEDSKKNVKKPVPGGWYEISGEHLRNISFSEDGQYRLTVSGKDLAGNEGKVVISPAFVIDRTRPDLVISGIKDQQAYNDEVVTKLTYSDDNLLADSLTYHLVGNKRKEVDYSVTDRRESRLGGRIIFEDFKREEVCDDIYLFSAKVSDLAGNTTTRQAIFSVNRFGSNYLLSDETQRLFEAYYVKDVEDIVIKEINVDPLIESELSIIDEDNKIYILEEGTDYEQKAEIDDFGWKLYTYVISKKVFDREGLYRISLSGKDQAGNLLSSEAKGASFSFILDQTAPSLAVNGLEEKVYKEHRHEVFLEAFDQVAVSYVEVYVDDKKLKSFKEDDLRKVQNKVSFVLEEGKRPKDIRLVVCDQAGNISDKEAYHYQCLVTTSPLSRFFFFFVDIFK